ncbi:MAG TPA: hypothetical protein VMR52_07860 [Dehalococcoidia bacterium]|nr:hypothetical protein [Dehalococcoidia bacterium]
MRLVIALTGALLLATLAACDEGDNIKSNEIVEAIPWAASETAVYRVLDDDDDEVGTLEMSIEQGGDTYVLRQYFEFPEDDFVNDAVVVVDAATLMPLTTDYSIEGPEGDITCEAVYDGGIVRVHNVRTDGERDDDLDIPVQRYDSWSDLFIWRTIDFSQGYDVEYADVVACQSPAPPDLIGTKLEVTGGEVIDVPAGTFDTWKVEIDAIRDQDAWFTTDEAHTLVKYDNGEVLFELIEAP